MKACFPGLLSVVVLVVSSPFSKAEDPTGQVRCFSGHEGNVRCVVVSPDGKHMLSGAWDGTMRVWDMASGKEIHCIRGYQRGIIGSVAFSPDGRQTVSVDADTRVWLHDVATGKPVRHFNAYTSHTSDVAFLPDGRHIVTSGGDYRFLGSNVDCKVKLWHLPTAKVSRLFKGHKSFVQCMAISSDGKYLLTGAGHYDGAKWPVDCTARLWEVATGKEIRRFEGHTYWVRAVAFSPDGKLALSGGGDATVRLWEVATGKEIRQFKGQSESVWSVSFSPDGRLIAAGVGSTGKDCTVRVWEVETARQIHCFTRHTGSVMTVAFTPDGNQVLSGSDDGTIRLWRLK